MIWQIELPAKVHSWLLGAIAISLGLSDYYFMGLLAELNEILRRDSYSVGQIEQLKQIIPPIRIRAWRMWWAYMWLKTAILTIAALLQDSFSPLFCSAAIFIGYAFLFLTTFISYWTKRTFRQCEQICEEISEREAAIKESKRLKSDMASGSAHDFKSDSVIKSYQNPAQTV